MKKLLFVVLILACTSCAVRKTETTKNLYEQARAAQEKGDDLAAIAAWKAVLQKADAGIRAGQYLTTNYFLRASAYFELGDWEKGIADLKQIDPNTISSEEFWIYPLYHVLMGDYYSQGNLPAVADRFYQSVLRKSTWKSSTVYLLCLERYVNNTVRWIDIRAEAIEDAPKFKRKEYESLAKEIEKYLEEFPHKSVPHYLLADLRIKTGEQEEALEHLIAALDLGLPTADLKKSAEFEVASLLTNFSVTPRLKKILLQRAPGWWSQSNADSIFRAGENKAADLGKELGIELSELPVDPQSKVHYLALQENGKWRILIWEQ